MAFSEEFKSKVLKAAIKTSMREASKKFNVSANSIGKWKAQRSEVKTVAPVNKSTNCADAMVMSLRAENTRLKVFIAEQYLKQQH